MTPIATARRNRMFPLVAVLALTGLSMPVGCRGGDLAVDEVVARVQAAQAEIVSLHMLADLQMEMDMPGLSGADTPIAMSFEQWIDGDKMRIEYADGPEELQGTVMVTDGETLTMYMASTNQFMETEVPDVETAGYSPAQTATMTREWVDEILKTNSITLGGIEEIAGRRTYKLHAAPKATAEAGATASGESTLWVDTETFYPLKLDLSIGPIHMTMTTSEVEYNPTVPAATFVLEAPPGAEISDVGLPDIENSSVEDAQAQVEFDLLEADAAATDFVLKNTMVSAMPGADEARFSAVTQTYTGPNGNLSVMQMPSAGDFDLAGFMGGEGGARNVDLGGIEASLVSLGVAGNMLSWQVGETQIILSGQVSEEDMLRFAESLH